MYVYGSRDEGVPDHYCSHSYDVLSSSDLVDWKHDQLSFATSSGEGKQTNYTQSWLYAPDCIHCNGIYYLYYSLADGGDDEGVATAKASPYGPFVKGQNDGRGARGSIRRCSWTTMDSGLSLLGTKGSQSRQAETGHEIH